MFGIGGGEMIVILILLLIAVGPDRMPGFMKAVGRGVREFRRTTRELRSTVGIDELLRDDDLRDPLGMRKPVRTKPQAAPQAKAPTTGEKALTAVELRAEQPVEGVDVAWMRLSAKRAAHAAAEREGEAPARAESGGPGAG